MYITAQVNRQLPPQVCLTCGRLIMGDKISYQAYSDEGARLGDVCQADAEVETAAALRDILRDEATALRRRASALEQLAGHQHIDTTGLYDRRRERAKRATMARLPFSGAPAPDGHGAMSPAQALQILAQLVTRSEPPEPVLSQVDL